MKHLIFLSLLFVVALFSCGNDDNNTVNGEPDTPDSVQPANKYPSELVGTWQFYSGDPEAILSSIKDSDILNHSFIFVANGNLNESIVYSDANKQGKTISANGNWMVENKSLRLTDWQGNPLNGSFSYKINADSSLTLINGSNSAVYYKQDDIKKKYPDLIVGSWNNMRDGASKARMSFYNTGRGYSETYYINGFYHGGEPFSWSYSDNLIIADYDHIAQPTGHHEYEINYVNIKSISWTYKNDVKHYMRE